MKSIALGKSVSVERMLVASAVFAEVFRAYPWLLLLSGLSISGWTEPPLSPVSALVIFTAMTVVVSISLAKGFALSDARIATLSFGIILVLLLTRLENSGGHGFWDPAWFEYASGKAMQLAASFIFGLFLIWRAITISREELRTDFLYRNFAIGIGSFVLLMVLWAAALGLGSGEDLFRKVGPYVLGYFFMGLMGLGLANFLNLRKGLSGKPRATDLFARRWLLLLLGVVLGIMIVGFIIASGLSVNLVRLIIMPLNTAAGWLATAFLYIIGYPLGFLAEGLGWIIKWIVDWVVRVLGTTPFEPQEFADFAENADRIQSGQIPEPLFIMVKWLLLLAVVGFIVYLLSRAIYRYWKGSEERGYEEIHESLWSWNGFGADLKSLLRGIAGRFRRPGRHAAPPLACTITEPQPLDIRELYRGLLWEGAASGHPKYHSHTPYEYRTSLENAVSGQTEPIRTLTDAYVRYRYGHMRASDEEGMALVHVWLGLRSAMRRVRGGAPPG